MRKQIHILKIIFLILCSFAFNLPALSQESGKKLDTPEYSPDYCQFTAKFPEEPYITHKCEDGDKGSCYNLISYTKVFDVKSTVRVEIICNPSTPAMYREFTPKVMESTVRAMTRGSVIEAYEILSHQEDGYRQSGLLGKGRKGLDDTIYIAQLWVAENSIMSVEAELIGEQSDESDQHFADILRSIGYSDQSGKRHEEKEQSGKEEEKRENAPLND